jgi:hypothetical protein
MENKGKLILTEIFPSVKNMIFKSIDTEMGFSNRLIMKGKDKKIEECGGISMT